MTHLNRRVVVLACLILGALSPIRFTAAAKDSAQNEKLLAAVEPFEGLTETALSGDKKKIDSAFKTVEKDRSATRALLSPANAVTFDKLYSVLAAAQVKQENITVSLQAAEMYKLIISSLDSAALAIPMEVSLMDYSGMRTNALLKALPPDWIAIAATAQESNVWWSKVSGRVADQKLRGDMDKAQTGLTNAAKTHDIVQSRSSAKEVLDIVDDLESYFAKRAKK